MNPPTRRGPFYTTGIARLKPGVGIAELRANLGIVAAGLKRQYPAPEDWTIDAVPLQEAIVGDVRQILYVLLGAVGFLLLIATANVANLLLARAAAREREIAVRGALGAGRRRIVAQLVTESVVLALVSGLVGLLLASWGTQALLAMAPKGIPRLDEVRMHVPVFLFALGVASLCGMVFGLVPALRASRTPLVETLEGRRARRVGAGHRRVQRLLVVAEIALALILSVGAGLMIRSFAELQRVSPGFDPGHLLTFEVALPIASYKEDARVRGFYDALVQKLEAVPGVRSVGLTISLPPNLLQVTDNFMVEGQVLPPNQSAPVGPVVMASDALFAHARRAADSRTRVRRPRRGGPRANGDRQRGARRQVLPRRRSGGPAPQDRRTRTADRSEQSVDGNRRRCRRHQVLRPADRARTRPTTCRTARTRGTASSSSSARRRIRPRSGRRRERPSRRSTRTFRSRG